VKSVRSIFLRCVTGLCSLLGIVCAVFAAYDIMVASFGSGKLGFFFLTAAVGLAVIALAVAPEGDS
jgi:hypothetical protein